jgi:hypothetical protein
MIIGGSGLKNKPHQLSHYALFLPVALAWLALTNDYRRVEK